MSSKIARFPLCWGMSCYSRSLDCSVTLTKLKNSVQEVGMTVFWNMPCLMATPVIWNTSLQDRDSRVYLYCTIHSHIPCGSGILVTIEIPCYPVSIGVPTAVGTCP